MKSFTKIALAAFAAATVVPATVMAAGQNSKRMSTRDRSTVAGAGIGAVSGAVLTGGSAIGTVGGAAVGSVIGNEVGKHRD